MPYPLCVMPETPNPEPSRADRAHRIGQASAVNVYFLHVRRSVDDIIWQAVQNKLENVGQALDGEDRGMEVSHVRTMPEAGQKSMHGFFAPTKADPSREGAERGGVGSKRPLEER